MLTRRLILVVGMHRSGTSAITRTLNLLGAALPPDLVPGDGGNAPGHWEPAALPGLHDRMLHAAGTAVNSAQDVDPAWFASEPARRFKTEMADFLAALPREPLSVLKDPRMARFVPVWREAAEEAGMKVEFVLPFRPPAEVAMSLQRRQLAAFPDDVWPLGRGRLLWASYVLVAERATRGAPRSFVAYDALLQDWRAEAARIGRQLDLAWPRAFEEAAPEIDRFLNPEHKHESSGADAATDDLSAAVHAQLLACVEQPQGGAEEFDAAAGALSQAQALYGEYVRAFEQRLGRLAGLRTEYGSG